MNSVLTELSLGQKRASDFIFFFFEISFYFFWNMGVAEITAEEKTFHVICAF